MCEYEVKECKYKYLKSLFRSLVVLDNTIQAVLHRQARDLNMVQLKQIPAAVAACLYSVWPEFRSLFLTRVGTAGCDAGSVVLLCSEGFPVGFLD